MDRDLDLSFDIDGLFKHMFETLSHDADEVFDWVFTFVSDNVADLNRVSGQLGEEFVVQVQEDVTVVDSEGNKTQGDPLLLVVVRGVFTVDQVKALAARMKDVANENNLVYEGVTCYDPVDAEDIYGWMGIGDAVVRMRHMTESGLAPDAVLPWCFLVETQSREELDAVCDELGNKGFRDRDDYTEPDDVGNFYSCVFVDGVNNEEKLVKAADDVAEIAKECGCLLGGIQFYTREDLEEIYGDDDEDEDYDDEE